MDVDRLAEIAAQLAGRVRDEDPAANAHWLATLATDPDDWFRLCFALAAAVPVERPWTELTAWTRQPRLLRPHGTSAAYKRHQYHREPVCEECKRWDRERKQAKRLEAA